MLTCFVDYEFGQASRRAAYMRSAVSTSSARRLGCWGLESSQSSLTTTAAPGSWLRLYLGNLCGFSMRPGPPLNIVADFQGEETQESRSGRSLFPFEAQLLVTQHHF